MKPVALITGVSGGIGSAVAAALAPTHDLVGWDIVSDGAPHDLLSRFSELDHEDEGAVELACRDLDTLDAVICVAGRALAEEAKLDADNSLPDPDTFRRSVHLNLVGHYNVIYHTAPILGRSERRTSITLVSSINTLQGFGLPAYTAAKAGLRGLTVSLAKHLGEQDVRINAVALGTVRTQASEMEWSHVPGRFKALSSESALHALATPEEAAEAICLVSTGLTHMTGQLVVVDGGQSIFRSLG
jgi:NAD(P)-dependent dehydrogenase (short-subunit alcohol dehydrogenase family)